MTLFSGQVVKRKPQDVLWETPLQKGIRESIDKHMLPNSSKQAILEQLTETVTPKERAVLEKRGLGPYEGNWHPNDMNKPDVQEMVRREVEWYMSK